MYYDFFFFFFNFVIDCDHEFILDVFPPKETAKKLTSDLKGEVSGDYSKALLLLAQVCHFHRKESCEQCFHF